MTLESTCLNVWLIFVGIGMAVIGGYCIRKRQSPIGAAVGKQAVQGGYYSIGGSILLFISWLLLRLTENSAYTILTPISILVHAFALYKIVLPPPKKKSHPPKEIRF